MIALLASAPLAAQDKDLKSKKPPAKKSAAKKPAPKPGARQQPTPDQIRRFNELQKKQ